MRAPRWLRSRGGAHLLFLCSLLSVGGSVGGTACSESPRGNPGQESAVRVQFENRGGSRSPVIKAEVARTEAERQMGLMYRKTLPETGGMLFLFPTEAERSFWMRNTFVELDLIFLNQAREVVSVTERARPLSETRLPSKGGAKYVLEVQGGRAKEWGVGEKSKLVLLDELPEAAQ